MLSKIMNWFDDQMPVIQYIIVLSIALIGILILVSTFDKSGTAVSIPATTTETGKIENHELAGSYRIDCLEAREVMTLYNPSFTQAEFIYTGSCGGKLTPMK